MSAFRVFTPERRGHGRTSDPGTITYENMATDTIAFLDSITAGPVHLVGWSDGAVVALLVAKWRPDLVERLVYIGNAINRDGVPAEAAAAAEHLAPDMLPPILSNSTTPSHPMAPNTSTSCSKSLRGCGRPSRTSTSASSRRCLHPRCWSRPTTTWSQSNNSPPPNARSPTHS